VSRHSVIVEVDLPAVDIQVVSDDNRLYRIIIIPFGKDVDLRTGLVGSADEIGRAGDIILWQRKVL
jgi:hypothetical protein